MSSFVRLGAFYFFLCVFCLGGAEQTQRGGGFTLLFTGTIVSFDSLKNELGSSATATSAGPTAPLVSPRASGRGAARTRLGSVWPCLSREPDAPLRRLFPTPS